MSVLCCMWLFLLSIRWHSQWRVNNPDVTTESLGYRNGLILWRVTKLETSTWRITEVWRSSYPTDGDKAVKELSADWTHGVADDNKWVKKVLTNYLNATQYTVCVYTTLNWWSQASIDFPYPHVYNVILLMAATGKSGSV